MKWQNMTQIHNAQKYEMILCKSFITLFHLLNIWSRMRHQE